MDEKLENEEQKIEDVEEANNEIEENNKEHFYNMQSMNCDYATYKLIRSKHNMPAVEKCRKCNKKFKDNDMLYTAYLEEERKTHIICKKCAKQE